MKYKIYIFKDGFFKKTITVEAKSHKGAAQLVIPVKACHFVITSKSTKRYNASLKLVQGEPRFFPVSLEKWYVAMMVDNLTEMIPFQTKEACEKACTNLESVKCANPDAPLNAITAYLDEINAFAGSTSNTISKTSVIRATPLDEQTLTSIGKSSGKSSVRNTERKTWKNGSNLFPIKAVVKTLPKKSEGVNQKMLELQGKVISVKKQDDYYMSSDHWYWKKELLRILPEAKVLKAEVLPENRQNYTPIMKRLVGRVLEFVKTREGYYKDLKHSYHFLPESLKVLP